MGESSEHKRAVHSTKSDFKDRCLIFEHGKIGNIKPDIIATCGKDTYIIENETPQSIRSKHTKTQINNIKKHLKKGVFGGIGYSYNTKNICYIALDKKSEKKFKKHGLKLCNDLTLLDYVE